MTGSNAHIHPPHEWPPRPHLELMPTTTNDLTPAEELDRATPIVYWWDDGYRVWGQWQAEAGQTPAQATWLAADPNGVILNPNIGVANVGVATVLDATALVQEHRLNNPKSV